MSSEQLLAKVKQEYENNYQKRTPKSRAAFEKALRYLPGGESRRGTFFLPYTVWIDKAHGCRFTDLDGNEYIDFHNCYSAMIVGHTHPKVVEAVKKQVEKITADPAVTIPMIRWAEVICQRVESFDKIRFTNSGTEAVMGAIRAARAFMGKDKIIKTDQGYHGTYDPTVYPSDAIGMTKSVLTDSIIVPYNDKEAAEKAIVDNKDQAAAMILEGQMGAAGQISPKEGYLQLLREVTAANSVLLILDEVQSFRLDYHGGMQHIVGIKPDLTILGKIIGGGFPAGAFAGREDIMDLLSPFNPRGQTFFHTGTFNANPVTATAGTATMELLTPEDITRINKLGDRLATGMREVFTKLNIKGQVTGVGSLKNYHFCTVPVIDGATSRQANKELKPLLHLALMERGIFLAPRGMFDMSTPMTEKEVDTFVKAFEDALSEFLPYIEQIWPELIGS